MEARGRSRGDGPEFRPLFIGLHWPSLPWGEESFGAGAASFGTDGAPAVDALLDAAIDHFGGSDEVRRPLEVIFRAFEREPGRSRAARRSRRGLR